MHLRALGQGQGAGEHVRGVDEGVAVHHAKARELRVLEPRDHAKDALLLAKAQVGLEAHQVVGACLGVLCTQLHGGPGAPARARVCEAHRLERPKAQGVHARARHLLDGLAGGEELAALEVLVDDALSAHELGDEGLVALLVEGRVEVVRLAAFVVARLRKDHLAVDGRGLDDGGGGVVESQAL